MIIYLAFTQVPMLSVSRWMAIYGKITWVMCKSYIQPFTKGTSEIWGSAVVLYVISRGAKG